MSDVRAVRRLIDELSQRVNTLPSAGIDTSVYASKDAVLDLTVIVDGLTEKTDVLKKSLDDALEKLGVFEKKLLEIESRKGVDDVLGAVDVLERKISDLEQRITVDTLSSKVDALEIKLTALESREAVQQAPAPAPAPASEIVYATTDDEAVEEPVEEA